MLVLVGCIDQYRIMPYAAVLTCYSMSIAPFAFVFGFIVDRSEYYGLPIFLVNTSLAVCGAYVGKAYTMAQSLKQFIAFLCPTIGMVEGIFVIETYLWHNPNTPMDWTYYDTTKHYPSLQAVNGIMGLSMIVYLFIAWGMPFDWVFRFDYLAENIMAGSGR